MFLPGFALVVLELIERRRGSPGAVSGRAILWTFVGGFIVAQAIAYLALQQLDRSREESTDYLVAEQRTNTDIAMGEARALFDVSLVPGASSILTRLCARPGGTLEVSAGGGWTLAPDKTGPETTPGLNGDVDNSAVQALSKAGLLTDGSVRILTQKGRQLCDMAQNRS